MMSTEDSPYRISGVQLAPDGVSITYMRMADLKENGLLFQRMVTVPVRADYDDEIERVVEAIETLIADVEDDEKILEPMRLGEDDDDGEDET